MNKILLILMVGLLHVSSALSQSLTTYYRSADGKQKEELKTALHEVIKDHKVFGYSSLWTHYETTDASMDDPNRVFDMFSTGTFYFASSTSSMNKEHVVPQSWWGKGAIAAIYTDLFNVYPSEAKANSAKSNYPIGKITGKVTFDNGRIRVGESSNSGGCGKVMEPYDDFKGDFARVYLYDATCYQDVNWYEIAYAFPTGVETYPTLEQWIIPILLEWNRLDPPSEWEMVRNDRVHKLQGNRNPFIDYPQLAEYIWGDSIAYAWDLDTAVPHAIGGSDRPGQSPDVVPGETPDEPSNPGKPDDDQPGAGEGDDAGDDDPEEVTPDYSDKEIIYFYDFADLSQGNSTETSGASSAWTPGDDSKIASVSSCYQAGGTVKLGTSKKNGSLTTVPLDVEDGDSFVLEISVKGWTTVEGKLDVEVDGCEKQTVVYTSTMSDKFETCVLRYDNITVAHPSVTITTTAKRCFVNSIKVYKPKAETPDGVDHVIMNASAASAPLYNLSGQRVSASYKGMVIMNGRKVVVR